MRFFSLVAQRFRLLLVVLLLFGVEATFASASDTGAGSDSDLNISHDPDSPKSSFPVVCSTHPPPGRIAPCLQVATLDNDTTSVDADPKANAHAPIDLYLRLVADFPERRGWAAFGTGKAMVGSLMFIFYPGDKAGDVTVSLRTTDFANNPPEHPDSLPKYTVVRTIVSGPTHTADVVCHGCGSWAPPKSLFSVTTKSQAWIWALHQDQLMQSNDPGHSLQLHSAHGLVLVDMTATRTKTAMTPDTELLGFERPGTASRRSLTHILFYMHGFFLTVTFTVFMPLAMAIMRGRMANAYRLHWMGQAIAVPTAIMGMGIAVVCSKTLISFGDLKGAHKIAGYLLIVCLLVQPILGYLHHVKYVQFQRRTTISHWHIWFGRAILVLGWVNIAGGLYLKREGIAVWLVWGVLLAAAGYILWKPTMVTERLRRIQEGEDDASDAQYELVDDFEREREGDLRSSFRPGSPEA